MCVKIRTLQIALIIFVLGTILFVNKIINDARISQNSRASSPPASLTTQNTWYRDTTFASASGGIVREGFGLYDDFCKRLLFTKRDSKDKFYCIGNSYQYPPGTYRASFIAFDANGENIYKKQIPIYKQDMLLHNPIDTGAFQADQKLLLGGSIGGYFYPIQTSSDFVLMRLDNNDELDQTFGTDGLAVFDFNKSEDIARDLIVQKDNKIIIGGSTISSIALLRTDQNGQLDTSFGTDGRVVDDLNGTGGVVNRIKQLNDGNILAVGNKNNGTLFVHKYSSRGDLIVSFDTIPGEAYGIEVHTDNKILIAGAVVKDSKYHLLIARYHPDGTLDQTFGTDGMVIKAVYNISPVWLKNTHLYDIKLYYNKILAVGTADKEQFIAIRLSMDGSADQEFGVDGLLQEDSPLEGHDISIKSIYMLQDGRFMIGGSDREVNYGNFKMYVSRYTSDNITPHNIFLPFINK